jgi:hypothetical protein
MGVDRRKPFSKTKKAKPRFGHKMKEKYSFLSPTVSQNLPQIHQ